MNENLESSNSYHSQQSNTISADNIQEDDIDFDFDYTAENKQEFIKNLGNELIKEEIEKDTFKTYVNGIDNVPAPKSIPNIKLDPKFVNATIINDGSIYIDINPNYTFDLLLLFNKFELDPYIFMMKLYRLDTNFPTIKIYKNIVNENTYDQLAYYIREKFESDDTTSTNYIQAIQGTHRLTNYLKSSDSTSLYDRLKFRVKYNNMKGILTSEDANMNISQSDLILLITLYKTGTMKIDIRIKNSYNMTIQRFKTEIIEHTINMLIRRIEELKPMALAKEINMYQSQYTFITKNLSYFDIQNTKQLDDCVQFFDVQINVKLKKTALNKIYLGLTNNRINIIRNLIKPGSRIVTFSLPFTKDEIYIEPRRSIVLKKIAKAIRDTKHKRYLSDEDLEKIYEWLRSWMIRMGYINPDVSQLTDIETKTMMNIRQIFDITKHKLQLEQKVTEYEDITATVSTMQLMLVKAFGISVRMHIDKIIIYGITSFTEVDIVISKIQQLLTSLKTLKIHVPRHELDMIQNLNILYTDNNQISETTITELLESSDPTSFDAAFELEDNAIMTDADREAEILTNIQTIMNKKEAYTLFSLLKSTNKEFKTNAIYAKKCQVTKPMFLLKSEYDEILKQYNSNQTHTKFENYVHEVLMNATQINDNKYIYYVCAYVFDSITRTILDPYKFVLYGRSRAFFVPDYDNDTTEFPQGIITKNDKIMKPLSKDYPGTLSKFSIKIDGKVYALTELNPPRYIYWKNLKSSVIVVPHCEIKPDYGLPCCFIKQFRSSEMFDAMSRYIYDPEKEEELINKHVKLPFELNMLFNNERSYKAYVSKYVRTFVPYGSFIHCFDPLLVTNHTEYPVDKLEDMWIDRFDTITEEQFERVKHGLLKLSFGSLAIFKNFLVYNINLVNELTMWELMKYLIPEYKFNIVIFELFTEVTVSSISLVYPQGYDLDQLYKDSDTVTIMLIKYTNVKGYTVYERIDNIRRWSDSDDMTDINYDADTIIPYTNSNSQFVRDIISVIKEYTLVKPVGNRIPTINELLNYIASSKTIPRTMYPEDIFVNEIGYIYGTTLRNGIYLPVYPIETMVDNKVIKSLNIKVNIITNEYPNISDKTRVDNVLSVFKDLYRPTEYIFNYDRSKVIGYLLNNSTTIYLHFNPVNSELQIKIPNSLGIFTQMYTVNNHTTDNEVSKYSRTRTILDNTVHAIEYILSEKMTTSQREEFATYLSFNDDKSIDIDTANLIQDFITRFIKNYVYIDPTFENDRSINVNIGTYNPCLTNRQCTNLCTIDKSDNKCKLRSTDNILTTAIQYITEKIINPFNPDRFKILYSTVSLVKNRDAIDVKMDSEILINETNFQDALAQFKIFSNKKDFNINLANLELMNTFVHMNSLSNIITETSLNSLTSIINKNHIIDADKFKLDNANLHILSFDQYMDVACYYLLQVALNRNALTVSDFRVKLYELLQQMDNTVLSAFVKKYREYIFTDKSDIQSIKNSYISNTWSFCMLDILLIEYISYSIQPCVYVIVNDSQYSVFINNGIKSMTMVSKTPNSNIILYYIPESKCFTMCTKIIKNKVTNTDSYDFIYSDTEINKIFSEHKPTKLIDY